MRHNQIIPKLSHFTIALLFVMPPAFAQDADLSLDDLASESVKVTEAFNGPQVILSQSTNMLEANRLDLVFGHRFGRVNEGAFNAFGLDQAFIRIGFEYGINDWLTAGIGRSSFGKNYDFYLKHRPFVQTTGGVRNIPVTAVVLFNTAFSSNELRRQNEIHETNQFVNQLTYTLQTSLSRRFSARFSAQVSGFLVHKNTVISEKFSNDVYGVGGGARLKLSQRIHLLAEYDYLFNNPTDISQPIAIGIDVVAGGHVFNLHFANKVGIIEKDFLTGTTEDKADRGLRFGFTVRRSFMLKSTVEGGKVKY